MRVQGTRKDRALLTRGVMNDEKEETTYIEARKKD